MVSSPIRKKTFEEDLVTTALDLKYELLQLDCRNDNSAMTGSSGQGDSFFYASDNNVTYLVNLLRIWLRTCEANRTKILVILDDVDGLNVSDLSGLADIINRDHIEVIYSTGDPMIADEMSYVHAANFDVPPLQPNEACELLEQLKQSNPYMSARRRRGASPEIPSSSQDMELILQVFASVCCLPAAIINISHYLKDHYGSSDGKSTTSYLSRWEPNAARSDTLCFRRNASRYPHSIQASFEVSMHRLERNTQAGPEGVYVPWLDMLYLVSSMKVKQFARREVDSLCALPEEFVRSDTGGGQDPRLYRLSLDVARAHRCITELIHASFLSDSEVEGVLVLNELMRTCVLVCRQDGVQSPILGAIPTDEAERLQRAGDRIARSWTPCLSNV